MGPSAQPIRELVGHTVQSTRYNRREEDHEDGIVMYILVYMAIK